MPGEPDLTRDAFDGDWLRTGDLARRDGRGHLVLVGRSKELVHRAGNKISPLEIERIFLEHPGVGGALATGVADGDVGERLHLFLVPAHEGALEEAAVLAWGAERLERHRLPDAVHFGEALPTGATGKADRGALRDLITGAGR